MPRKTITALAAAWMLAFPPLCAWGAVQGSAATTPKKTTTTLTVTSPSVKCKRWGYLVLKLKVRKTTTLVGTKKIVKVQILDVTWPTYPDATFRSIYINDQALPLLKEEALEAQGPNVEVISGATDITGAFKESLQAAILEAKQ